MDPAWSVKWAINVEFTLYRDLAAPIQGHHDLSDDDDDTDDDVAECDNDKDAWHHCRRVVMQGLVPERLPSKHIPYNYVHRLCMFRYLAWLDGPRGQGKGP